MSSKAFEDLAFLAKRLAGVIALKDELETYDAFKNHCAELKARIESYQKDIEGLLQKKFEAADSLSATLKNAEDVKAAASEDANRIVLEAKAKAAEIVDVAKNDAAAAVKDANDKVHDLEATISALSKTVKELTVEKGDVESKIHRFKIELEDLKKKF